MGVYIRGMEMPTSCAECPVNMNICKRGYKYLLEHMELYDQRANDCPIRTVPPHGRLIDADAEVARVKNLYNKAVAKDPEMGCVSVYEGEIAVLKLAPTIIPAEEGE